MDRDLHLETVAYNLRMDYAEVLRLFQARNPEIVEARRYVKLYLNFGFPGGLSPSEARRG